MIIQAWMRGIMILGGAYHVLWFLFLYYFQKSYLLWITEGVKSESSLTIYQALLFLAVGLMLLFSIVKPVKYRALIAGALLLKLIEVVFAYAYIVDFTINNRFIFHFIMNGLIWIAPLGLITKVLFFSDSKK